MVVRILNRKWNCTQEFPIIPSCPPEVSVSQGETLFGWMREPTVRIQHSHRTRCELLYELVQTDIIWTCMFNSDGNRFQFPKSIIGNKSNSILELESVSWCADCGIWIHNSKSLEIHLPRYWCDMPPIQHTLLCLETAIFHSCSLT